LNIGLSISLAALIMPLSFILTTLTTTSITGPAVYAYDVMETDDSCEYLVISGY
jgi:hypothetical protein